MDTVLVVQVCIRESMDTVQSMVVVVCIRNYLVVQVCIRESIFNAFRLVDTCFIQWSR